MIEQYEYRYKFLHSFPSDVYTHFFNHIMISEPCRIRCCVISSSELVCGSKSYLAIRMMGK